MLLFTKLFWHGKVVVGLFTGYLLWYLCGCRPPRHAPGFRPLWVCLLEYLQLFAKYLRPAESYVVRQLEGNVVYTMLVIVEHRFVCGERRIWWSIKGSQNIMKWLSAKFPFPLYAFIGGWFAGGGGGVGGWGVWGGMGWGVFPVAVIHGVFETGSGFRFSCGMMRCGIFSSFLGF